MNFLKKQKEKIFNLTSSFAPAAIFMKDESFNLVKKIPINVNASNKRM